jgi:hypothetical protein
MKSTPEELERRVELLETLLDRADKRFDQAEVRIKGRINTLWMALGIASILLLARSFG